MADENDLNDDEFRLPTNERLKQSKKKRAQQLKKYAQHEKQLEKESGKKVKKLEKVTGRKNDKKVQFPGSVTLLEAAAREDKEEVRRLLHIGVSPDVCNEDGLTALHQCCIDDAGEMMNVLLEFGASVNAVDCELWTPLHAAATCGRINLCRRLIEHGADLLAVNGDGNMPYDICDHEATLDYIEYEMAKQDITQNIIDEKRLVRERRMLQDLKALHTQNKNLEFRGQNGETPLHIAAANGYLDVADFLLSCRVRVDPLDNDLWQPIHCAACWGQLTVLELLLEHGASLEVKTSTGATPLDICEDCEMKQRILEIKEDIENSRISKSRELSRRHSSTIRSASIRRTSMREKNELSWKDAKEEARRMRESTDLLQDMEDDEGEYRKENGVSVRVETSKKTLKGILLTPIVSVEEILDTQSVNSKSGSRARNDSSNSLDTPSPRSPDLLLARGFNPGWNSPQAQALGGKPEEVVKQKTNGLPATPAGGITGTTTTTLPELKVQRSNTRLSEIGLEFHDATQGTTSLDKNENPNQPAQPVAPLTERPTVSSTSSYPSYQSKAPATRATMSRKCCVII